MIWNAPIWINEMLVSIISFIVGLMFFILTISFIFIIVRFVKFMIIRGGHNRKLMDFIKTPSTLIVLISLVISGAVLELFYMPQKVIPEGCRFSEISMTLQTISVVSDRVNITDNEKLNELRNIFSTYLCRRSLEKGGINHPASNIREVDMVINSNNKSSPFHFIVASDYSIRYISANTDFFYLIKDNNHELAQKITFFFNKYKDSK